MCECAHVFVSACACVHVCVQHIQHTQHFSQRRMQQGQMKPCSDAQTCTSLQITAGVNVRESVCVCVCVCVCMCACVLVLVCVCVCVRARSCAYTMCESGGSNMCDRESWCVYFCASFDSTPSPPRTLSLLRSLTLLLLPLTPSLLTLSRVFRLGQCGLGRQRGRKHLAIEIEIRDAMRYVCERMENNEIEH